ncbi:MAG: hypothetical protein M3116_06580 [Actinomycetota bacterium]|nr:hypothetical protein [Actinomycetota bacterium]
MRDEKGAYGVWWQFLTGGIFFCIVGVILMAVGDDLFRLTAQVTGLRAGKWARLFATYFWFVLAGFALLIAVYLLVRFG